ncbi:methyltransferase domain-containing protein [Pseudodesulfovibrio cashew]|uniref:Methyltransferase domain-containing protein n=1 Tax=Pseudodesulfovibrio cashew TaxID=2678688 RepID=A0A6I6JFG9_9BACT|nr:methyltransferase domain-containing protein [Pseudodesulfovibrio cashew]QGY39919.1 methyltransferase domain-containing protein [Pseudodesulfovibrio cashew]
MKQPLTGGELVASQKQVRTLGVIRASLHNGRESDVLHLERIAETLSKAKSVEAVVLAMPDDDYHASLSRELTFCEIFLGDVENMNNRLLEAARSQGASCLVDCSLLTQCLDPHLYDELVDYHNASPGSMTRPSLWYPEYLPNVVDVDTLSTITEEYSWPYYSHVSEAHINYYTPNLDKITHLFSHLNPICQELVIHKGRQLRNSMNLAVHPYDPVNWASRCASLLPKIENLFHKRSVSVLEVGCGRRFGLGILLRMAGIAQYSGIDLNLPPLSDEQLEFFEEWLSFNQQAAPISGMSMEPIVRDECSQGGYSFFEGSVQLRAMDACALEFEDNSFDLIFSDAVLEHIAPCKSAIKEMYRVLKPGGFAVHGIDFKDHMTKDGDSHLYVSKKEWHEKHRSRLINLSRPAEMYSWFSEVGFHFLSISEDKFTEADSSQIHADHLAFGVSDALTHASHVVMQKAG